MVTRESFKSNMAVNVQFLNLAASRGVRTIFREFTRQARSSSVQRTAIPAVCYSTGKEEINSNPFFEKYAEKIKRAQGSQSNKNASQAEMASSNFFENVLEQEIESVKEKSNKNKSTISPNSRSCSRTLYGRKGLDAILRLEKVKEESASTIEQLWREYHRDKDSVSAVLPAEMYDRIQERAKQYPIVSTVKTTNHKAEVERFIYPVPRNEGYELMVGEFSEDQFYLTSVLNYQTLGENSPWLIAFTHFTELKESKGIVLMVGEVDIKHFTTHEAMFVANLIQLYYGTEDENKLSLLKTFTTNPDQFNHMSVIEEMQRSTVQFGEKT